MIDRDAIDSSQEHIVFVVNNYLPSVGGVEHHVSHLAYWLEKLGSRASVISIDNVLPSGVENGIPVLRIKGTPAIGGVLAFPWFGASRRIRKHLRESGATLISVHTRFFPMSYIGVLAARRLGIPSLLTEHGSDSVRGVNPLVSLASKLVDRTLGQSTIKKATKVLGISEGSVQFINKLAKVRASVFHNAIDVDQFIPQRSSPERCLPKLVFVGRLVPGKGWQKALEVAEQLADKIPDIQLHIIGDGPDRENLELQIANSPRLSQVSHVHGYLQAHEISKILQFGLLLNPTNLAEGFQTTLLEAIASNAKIISTPVFAAIHLASIGADIKIIAEDSADHWAKAAEASLTTPLMTPDAEMIKSFDWSLRSAEYLSIVESLLQRRD